MRRDPTRLDLLLCNLRSGVRFGAGAYLLGYLSTFLSTVLDSALSAGSAVSMVKQVGWVFYGTHHVALQVTTRGWVGPNTRSVQVVSAAARQSGPLGDTVPGLLYKLLPALLLVAAGYLVYRRGPTPRVSLKRAAGVGAVTAAGYLPLTVLGRYLVAGPTTVKSFGIEQTVTGAPTLTTSVLVMGIAYPVVFGGIGGYLAERRQQDATRS